MMIVLVVNFKIKEGKRAEFLEAIAPLVEGSQNEPGCIEYDLFADTEDANAFVLLEKWPDQAALDFHNTTDHYRNCGPKVREFCEDVTLHRFVPVG